jgi:SAM-dependent methyltransferase
VTTELGAWSREVARYYDENTRRFLLVGGGRGVHSMHRELWGPGVGSAREAAEYIHHVIADVIAERVVPASANGGPVVLDFGCGVGGTLFHLAERFPRARLKGITVSGRQVEIATRLAGELGCADRCSFALGDFQTADLAVQADAIVAIEAVAHASSIEAFMANAARHVRPGGCVIIADDFLASESTSLNGRQRRHVEQFKAGWRVPAVCTVAALSRAAAGHGLLAEKTVDLTSLTRPGSRARDRIIAALTPLMAGLRLERVPFYGNMTGGHALQVGLREGFLRYALLVLRKGAA